MRSVKQKYIFTIDLGTSGPKVALVSPTGDLLDCEMDPVNVILLPDGGAEQRPEDWWQAVCTATHRLINKYHITPSDVTAISCTSQWSGTVPVGEDGKPLMNAIIWMDSRGSRYIRKITRGLVNIQGYDVIKMLTWISLTGGIPAHAGKDSIAHIIFIKHELPEIYERTYKFLEPKDYINLLLTGRFAASFDSICLHWLTDNRDITNVDYDPRLLRFAGIEREKLPDLMRSVEILGPLLPSTASELGLQAGIPVIVGTPDIHSAAIGSGAVRDCEPHLYIGTSSWLACHVPYKKTDLLHNIASLPSAIPGRYLVTNEQECAGGCLTYLRDKIIYPHDSLSNGHMPEDVFMEFNKAAAEVPPGSQKVIFTPWLYGERTPVDDHAIRGGFFNQTLHTTRAHLIRAVFEGVAYNSRWLLKYVEKFVRRPMDKIRMVGGGANSDLWCQIHADVLNRIIVQVKEPVRVNLRGAAFLAGISLGVLDVDDIPNRVNIQREYYPNQSNLPIYNQLFKEFVNLYHRTRPIYARLNR